jgi:hypothetical protein
MIKRQIILAGCANPTRVDDSPMDDLAGLAAGASSTYGDKKGGATRNSTSGRFTNFSNRSPDELHSTPDISRYRNLPLRKSSPSYVRRVSFVSPWATSPSRKVSSSGSASSNLSAIPMSEQVSRIRARGFSRTSTSTCMVNRLRFSGVSSPGRKPASSRSFRRGNRTASLQ